MTVNLGVSSTVTPKKTWNADCITGDMLIKLLPLAFVGVFAAGCAASAQDPDLSGEDGTALDGESEALLAGRTVSQSETAQLLADAGFDDSVIAKMVCTAKHESSFRERATNKNRNGSLDRGLFQINSIHVGGTRGCPSSGDSLFTASVNAKCAKAIFDMQGIKAWYGYRSHKTECDNFKLAGGAPDPTPAPSGTDASSPTVCRSKTLSTWVDEKSCVQSASNSKWYQCVEGKWLNATSSSGPSGSCTESFALSQ
jgi:C-type lysozyme/alpha-lactalbumin family